MLLKASVSAKSIISTGSVANVPKLKSFKLFLNSIIGRFALALLSSVNTVLLYWAVAVKTSI